MKQHFNLIMSSLISSSISSICFYLAIRIILKEDILIINSFNNLFFEISTEELSIISLGFSALFYSCLFLCILKTNSNNLKSKFKFIEYCFWITIIIFVTYFYLQITDPNELQQCYIDILFLIYMSLFIFGFVLFISISIMVLITNRFNKHSY